MSDLFLEPVAKDWLEGMLKTGPAKITFTKTDGTERIMNCTLNESVVVAYERRTERTVRPANENVLVVFDIDKNQWRSFRLSSITKIEFTI